MAYDAATGTTVLFGGATDCCHLFGDTWTWDGSAWTKRAPASHPPARAQAAMAYDAGTGTIVLFGGDGPPGVVGDTWTWAGSTWTQHRYRTAPSGRSNAAMAYDAATSTVVLFGGFTTRDRNVRDTWTWG